MSDLIQECTFGYLSGSFGYNTVSYIVIEPLNKKTVTYTITIPPEKESGKPIVLSSMTTNKPITIDQINIEPYPKMAINIDGINIHSKKYYYEKVKVSVTGECNLSIHKRQDIDR